MEIPTYRYNSNKAREYADLFAIDRDLSMIEAMLERLKEDHDAPTQYGLYTAVLITYRRCFNDGVRAKIPKADLSAFKGGPEFHNYCISMADKLAAHSVNGFEQMAVGFIISNGQLDGPLVVTSIRIGDALETVDQFLAFVQWIRKTLVAPRLKDLSDQVYDEARAKPLNDIIRAGPLPITVPTGDKANRKRD